MAPSSQPGGGQDEAMDEPPRTEAPAPHDHAVEVRKEAYTMALYVAICLLAALIALPDEVAPGTSAFGLIWGVTLGLMAAHWFAFRLSAQLVGAGSVRPHDAESAVAQLSGAVLVALLASIPVLLLPDPLDFDQFELACFIAVIGYTVARRGGATWLRSVLYSAAVLTIGAGIATLKGVLAGGH
jgi:hypothetical protein